MFARCWQSNMTSRASSGAARSSSRPCSGSGGSGSSAVTETELQYARKPAARGTPRRRLALIVLGVAVVQFVVLAGLAVLMSAPEASDARLAPESTLAVPSPPSHSPLAASIATAAPAAAASTFNEQLARRASAAAAASASAKRQLAQRSAAIGNAAAAATATTTTAANTAVAGGGGNSGELAVSEPEALAALEEASRRADEAEKEHRRAEAARDRAREAALADGVAPEVPLRKEPEIIETEDPVRLGFMQGMLSCACKPCTPAADVPVVTALPSRTVSVPTFGVAGIGGEGAGQH